MTVTPVDEPEAKAAPEGINDEVLALEECDHDALVRQLAEKIQEVKELKELYEAEHDRLLRLAAEMENFKKRQERERAEVKDYAIEGLAREILPVLDSLELALEHGRQQATLEAILKGVENVHKALATALQKFGVTPIQALGEKFDPNFHNAVMQRDDPTVEDQTVIQELQKGYLLKNRLLRPAMVVVARQPQEQQN